MKLLILLLICSFQLVFNSCESIEDDFTVVTSIDGKIKGKELKTVLERKRYYAFKGIPYAKPPINELRFKEPMKLDSISDLEAFEFGNICVQHTPDNQIVGNEDCLYLNIYTPDLTPNAKLAVMFYVHGGGFHSGSSNDIGPDFLIDETVIVVTVNYRVGILGFMSLGSTEYAGNMGLKDQLMALKWVNEHIHNFGGDKSAITLIGHSAGAAIVHYNVISPVAEGLYKRAIIMSGSSLNNWAFNTSQTNILDVYKYASEKDKTVKTYKDLVKFLHTVDAKTITNDTLGNDVIPGFTPKMVHLKWIPIEEIDSNKNTFIHRKPWEQAESSSSVDTMFGITNRESLFVIAPELHNPDLLQSFNEIFQFVFPIHGLDVKIGSEEYTKLAQKVRNFYFGENNKIDNSKFNEYIDFFSDVFFGYSVYQAAKTQSRKSTGKTYFYRFAVDAKFNLFKQFTNVTHFKGASHVDELYYLMRCNFMPNLYDNLEVNSIEWKTVIILSQMWANFAKFGTPKTDVQSIDFKPIEKGVMNYLNIDNDGLASGIDPHKLNYKFWDDIYSEYGSSNLEFHKNKDEF